MNPNNLPETTLDDPQESGVTHVYIPAHIMARDDLTLVEKVLLGKIVALSGKEGYCYASNAYLGEQLDKSPSTISRYISKFVRMGLIMQGIKTDEKGVFTIRTLTVYLNGARGGTQKCVGGVRKNAYQYIENNKEITRKATDVAQHSNKQSAKGERAIEQEMYPDEKKSHSNEWKRVLVNGTSWEWNPEQWRLLAYDELYAMATRLDVDVTFLQLQQNSIEHLIKKGQWQLDSAWKYQDMADAVERRTMFRLEKGALHHLTEDERNIMALKSPEKLKHAQEVVEKLKAKGLL